MPNSLASSATSRTRTVPASSPARVATAISPAAMRPAISGAFVRVAPSRHRPRSELAYTALIRSASRSASAPSAARAASSASTATASSPRTSVAAVDRLAQAAHRRPALLGRQAVEDEHAVEVVDLVLDDARFAALGVHHDGLAVLVARDHAHARRPRHLDPDAGQAQAALGEALLLAGGPLDLGIDEHAQRRVGGDAVDEQPVEQPDLVGRQPGAERLVHEPRHARRLVDERGVEAL